MQCSQCHQENPSSAKFCSECGHPLSTRTAPGGPPRSPATYTPAHLVEKILTSRSALEGERKQVTVLFCDIANSTALAERLGPEAMHSLLNRFFDLALAEVHRYEGTINQFLGDGFMALFGAPIAYEDHARRGVLAALGIHGGLGEQRVDLGSPHGGNLAVRIGLNTGLVVVGKIGDNLRMDYTAVGDTTNLAARLQQIADPGTVCLSETTHRAVMDYFDCQPLGTRTVKGKPEPVTVYKVLGVRAHPESGREDEVRLISSPLVGRGGEFATLRGCIEGVLAGQGGIVCVIGEPGIGKSRLVAEVRRQVARPELLWLEGRALSFSQTISYWPFLEIIRSYAGINENDREDESWAKLERRVTALFPDQVPEILPYLGTLLAYEIRGELAERVKYLDGRAMGRQILLTLRRFFERLARERSLALVFQDLHWMDQSSAELLEHLLPLVGKVPLLIWGVGRPDAQTPAARLRQIAIQHYPTHYTEIALSSLPAAASDRLVQNLLQIHDIPARLRRVILAKAEGNPFYMEEVIRALIAMGALVRDKATGGWRSAARVEEITVPDTIQGVIMARVDRLDEDLKQVLKLASVIGRSFFYRVLRAIAEAERELDRHLAELQHVEFIRESRRIPELEFIFKHALVQEATYDSILVDRRRQLHRQVGECIEALFPDRLEDFYGLLAYHYARAEDPRKAHEYLLKAGDQAGKVAADAEALPHYRQALAIYERMLGDRWDPLERAALERKIGEALFRRGEHQQAIEYLQRSLSYLGTPSPTSRWGIRLSIAGQVGQQAGHRLLPSLFLRHAARQAGPTAEERVRIYELMGWIDYFMDLERLVLDVLLLLNVSEQSGLSVGMVQGNMAVGLICDLIPAFRLAEHYHNRAVALAEQIQHPLAIAQAYLGLAVHEYNLGKWETALEHARGAGAAYREAGDLRGWGLTTQMIAWLLRLRGDFTQSLGQSQEVVRVGQDAADHQVWAWGLHGCGRTLWHAGALDEAVAYLQDAIELYQAIPDYQTVAEASSDLGECYLRQGKLKEALAALDESNQLIAQRRLRGVHCTRPRNGLAEAYLVMADRAEERERAGWLRKAKQACQAALKQSKSDRQGMAGACRLQGTYEWLRCRPAAARKWWLRSLAVAMELEARYDLGVTNLEMGRRMGDRVYLERAEAIFAEIGAMLDLACARELLNRAAA